MRRAIMACRENRHRDEDAISHYWFEGKVPGLLAEPLDVEKREVLRGRFYTLRGWDTGTGRPTRETPEALHMGDVADGPAIAGKLGGT